MISVDKVVAADYYVEQVARDRHDYLSGDGEAPGVWDGALANQFGLSGEVSEDGFRALLAERHPVTGERLKRQSNKKVAGWDLTFSPPKSISALWAIAGDDVAAEVRAADEAAGKVGLAFMERYACLARLGRDGVDRQPGTGFAAASFTHRTSREGDPQLHTHRVLANVVEAGDGRRAALDGALLWPWRFAADQVYLAALRAELTARLGVRWVERNGVWEIDGIPPGLCRAWSKRRAQIEQAMAERGASGGRAAQVATLATRKPKVAEETGPLGLRERLHQEAVEAGIDVEAVLDYVLDRDRLIRRDTRAERTVGLSDDEIVERLVGPEGLTEQASGFGRRDVYKAAGALLIADQPDAQAAMVRIDGLVDRVLADPRVVALIEPARKTSGEVIRPRDSHGRVLKEVCTQAERRYTTVSLIAAERELVDRALARQDSGTAVVPEQTVEQAIAGYNTATPDAQLDADQETMVRHLCGSGNGVTVVVGKAGTGKSTALQVARQAFEAAGLPVIGVAPTANAARQLEQSAGIADSGTLDRLLVEVAHGVRRLPAGAVVVLDEAGMCSTRNRLALQRAVDRVGGKVADVGDHRQIPSVDVGGGHAVLARELGAVTLGTDHRFKIPKLRDAAELVRDGDAEQGVALLAELGMVTEADHPGQVWSAMVDDWLDLRDQAQAVRMLATENSVVDKLNTLARARLVERGAVARRGREYASADDAREIFVAVGDRVRLGRNGVIGQPDKSITTVRNGMEGTVTRTGRRAVVVQLDDEHADGQAELHLPGWYVGEHIDHAYAVTADKAQGITVDHSLFAPSAATSQERAYVALSRGRYSNRVYATAGSGWREAIATPRGHVFATEQSPDIDQDLAARILRMRDHPVPERPRTREHDREAGRERGTGRAIGR